MADEYASDALSRTWENRPNRVIPFPGERGEKLPGVMLWCLSKGELGRIRIATIRYLQETCKLTEVHLANDTSLAEEEFKTQLLFEACRDAKEPKRRWFRSDNAVRDFLEPDECEALFQAYLDFVDERSPLKKIRSDAELDKIVSALGKDATARTLLNSYDSVSLRSIARELAIRLITLTNKSFWNTSPTNEGSVSSTANPAP
jgi:hypothetical protein